MYIVEPNHHKHRQREPLKNYANYIITGLRDAAVKLLTSGAHINIQYTYSHLMRHALK